MHRHCLVYVVCCFCVYFELEVGGRILLDWNWLYIVWCMYSMVGVYHPFFKVYEESVRIHLVNLMRAIKYFSV